MTLHEKDARKPTRELFDPSALSVVEIMAEEMVGLLSRMEQRLVNRFGDTVPGQEALSEVSMQAIIHTLCSYTHAAFDGQVDVRTVVRRLVRTWSEMELGSELSKLGKKAEKAGLS